MGVPDMASMLTQQSLSNDCNDSEPILPPHPDQTDTIDGELFLIHNTATTKFMLPFLKVFFWLVKNTFFYSVLCKLARRSLVVVWFIVYDRS